MVIRILPRLSHRQEWIDFCSRETSYCYVEQPSTLVDFQSSLLMITLLPDGLIDGRKAVKYSIGSPQTIKPAWDFIEGCRFNLNLMVEGLETVDFSSNARDNHHLGFCPEANVRKFFNKESAIIAPNSTGTLNPIIETPETWRIHHIARLIANDQFTDFRSEQSHLNTEPDGETDPSHLLVKLIEQPQQWQVRIRNRRLWLINHSVPRYSLLPELNPRLSTLDIA